jgi:hypothetical protein
MPVANYCKFAQLHPVFELASRESSCGGAGLCLHERAKTNSSVSHQCSTTSKPAAICVDLSSARNGLQHFKLVIERASCSLWHSFLGWHLWRVLAQQRSNAPALVRLKGSGMRVSACFSAGSME